MKDLFWLLARKALPLIRMILKMLLRIRKLFNISGAVSVS
jgi:hypothetical protein